MITVVSSDGFLVQGIETIIMIGFMMLAYNIGEPAFMFYIVVNQVQGVSGVIRAMTGDK
jgi:hypothetical protein